MNPHNWCIHRTFLLVSSGLSLFRCPTTNAYTATALPFSLVDKDGTSTNWGRLERARWHTSYLRRPARLHCADAPCFSTTRNEHKARPAERSVRWRGRVISRERRRNVGALSAQGRNGQCKINKSYRWKCRRLTEHCSIWLGFVFRLTSPHQPVPVNKSLFSKITSRRYEGEQAVCGATDVSVRGPFFLYQPCVVLNDRNLGV